VRTGRGIAGSVRCDGGSQPVVGFEDRAGAVAGPVAGGHGQPNGTIHLLDESGQSLHLAASQGIRREDIARISSVAVDQGLVGLVVEDGRPLVLPRSSVARGR